MGILICRDLGCELTYCRSTISDPYYRPYNSCDALFNNFNRCIDQQMTDYEENDMGMSIQQYTTYMIEKRRKEKYSHLFIKENKLKEMKEEIQETPPKMKMEMEMTQDNSKL